MARNEVTVAEDEVADWETPRRQKPLRGKGVESFDVTQVIGTVEMNPNGTMPPHVAAFALIAEHDAPGEFTFPHPNGGTTRVIVQFDNPQ